MTKLLEKAIAEVRRLPNDRQDEVAEILLEIVAVGPSDYRLSAEQIADLEERLVGSPDYASEDETAALFERLTK